MVASIPSQAALVTIGIPTRNGAKSLRRALDSLVVQDYPSFEIVISDNASTDTTPQLCAEYAEHFSFIRFYRNKNNIGIVPNFRRVLTMASGEYFMWAADDDWWAPQFVSTLVEELKKHEQAVVAMSTALRVTPNGDLVDYIRFSGAADPNNKSYFGMALAILGLTEKLKHNIYMLGVFRTEILQRAFEHYPDIPGVERPLLAQLALVGSFRFVDKPLFRKTLYERSQPMRRPEEVYNKRRNERGIKLKRKLVIVNRMLRSPVIPWWRKIYAPVIFGMLLVKYLWRSLLRVFVIPVWVMVKPYLADSVVRSIRRRFGFIVPKKMS